MLKNVWKIRGIDCSGAPLVLRYLIGWGAAGAMLPVAVTSTVALQNGDLSDLLRDDASTVTFAAADVKSPGFVISFEFAEPVALWGFRFATALGQEAIHRHSVQYDDNVIDMGHVSIGVDGVSLPPMSEKHIRAPRQPFALTSAGVNNWQSIDMPDSSTVYAAPFGGVIRKSTDSGTTWATLNASGSRNWYGIAAHVSGVVYAVASASLIYKSTDGGNTWATLPGSGVRSWRAVATHDGVTVFAAVDGGFIYKSVDGGVTWSELTAAGSRWWYSLSTADGVNVYACVYNGAIYKSTNGGATWVALAGAGVRGWNGVVAQGVATVHACVYNGAIYKSTDGGDSWAVVFDGMVGPWADMATPDGAVFHIAAGVGIYKGIDYVAPYVSPPLRYKPIDIAVKAGVASSAVPMGTTAVHELIKTRDLDAGGAGRIYGTVGRYVDDHTPPIPIANCRVLLLREDLRLPVRQAWSDASGSFEFTDLSSSIAFSAQAWDTEGDQQAIIYDRLTAEVSP